ncbi:MAG TPA: FHA domain-containing protein, partial [Gemmatimonadaceae bacterium]|nr:FHA domain-containing protein [Gemmatimonadaceae bacterium]
GRLVSLVDGREYTVGPTGLTLGRDAGCDVVVASPEVSRRHAELAAGAEGYLISDLSTNGVFVNGQRINKTQRLARGDVLRIGTEEFRFYADTAAPAAPASASAPAAGASAPAEPPAPAAPPVARAPAAPAAPTPAKAPAAVPEPSGGVPASAPPAPDTRPLLATLEVMNEGPNKGKRFEIRAPLVHIGRGAHNDVALNDDSVSDSHAKIQKREAGWFVVDMGSTNGTWCGGERIAGEASLKGHASLRFGAMRLTFAAADEGREGQSGTRVMRGLSADQAARPVSGPARVAEPPEGPAKSGVPGWVWVVVLLLIAAAIFFFLGSRR